MFASSMIEFRILGSLAASSGAVWPTRHDTSRARGCDVRCYRDAVLSPMYIGPAHTNQCASGATDGGLPTAG